MNFPACMHCQQPFDAHAELPSGDRSCPGGGGTFDVQFVASPEVIDFVKANLDKSPKELADLWIERVLSKGKIKP